MLLDAAAGLAICGWRNAVYEMGTTGALRNTRTPEHSNTQAPNLSHSNLSSPASDRLTRCLSPKTRWGFGSAICTPFLGRPAERRHRCFEALARAQTAKHSPRVCPSKRSPRVCLRLPEQARRATVAATSTSPATARRWDIMPHVCISCWCQRDTMTLQHGLYVT
jgi:hypothetical protein